MPEEEKENNNHLIDHAEAYFKTRQELVKLILAEKASAILSSVITSFILFIIFFLVCVFISFAIIYLISEYTGKIYLGFIGVASMYLVIGLFFYWNRENVLRIPLMNIMINNYFKHEEN